MRASSGSVIRKPVRSRRSRPDPGYVEGWKDLLPLRDGAPSYWGFLAVVGITIVIISFVFPLVEVLGIAGVVACGWAILAGRLPCRPGGAGLFLVAVLAVATLSYFGAQDPFWARIRLEELAKITVIFLLAVLVLPWGKRPVRFAAAWFVAFLLFPVRGAFVNYLFAGYRLDGRMIWNYVWENPNDLAGIALVTGAVGLALHAVVRSKPLRALLLAGVMLCVAVVVLSGSRGVLLGTMAAGGMYFILRKFDARIILAAGALIIAGWFVVPDGIKDRMGTLAHVGNPSEVRSVDAGSMMERRRLWRGAAALVQEHPLTGVGIGSSGQAYRNWVRSAQPAGRDQGYNFTYYSGYIVSLHNTFLTVWTELGTIGLLLFLGFLGSVWRSIWKARRRPSPTSNRGMVAALDALEAGLVGLLVASMFASYDVLTHFYLYFALVLGWTGAVRRTWSTANGRVRAGRSSATTPRAVRTSSRRRGGRSERDALVG